jgi:hypothetical protein
MSAFSGKSAVPLAAIMAVAAVLSLAILLLGRRNIKQKVEAEPEVVGAAH